jgi:diguanylate cyclase (GGDEF)-like protein
MKIAVFENQKIAAHVFTHKSIKESSIDLNDELNMLKENFKLQKVNYFDASGVIIASTNIHEIGTQNKEAYFINNVKKGKIFFKVVHKNTKSMDNKVVDTELLEVYYPMEKIGDSFSAIEIYYDISHISKEFDSIIEKIDYIYFIIVTVFMFIFSFILYRLSLSDLNRQRNEKEIALFNKTLQEKVQKRTFQLLKKNKELEKLANIDSLTGIYNRGFFLNIATKYFDVAKRNKTLLYVVSFDLDYFKMVNDTYGHAMGDEVLKAFTRITSMYMRNSDVFGRIGGEEFMACIQNSNDEGILIFTHKIKDAIEKMEIECHGTIIKVTVSIGIAKLEDETSFELLIEKSDKALYEAKKSGRNKVCFAH